LAVVMVVVLVLRYCWGWSLKSKYMLIGKVLLLSRLEIVKLWACLFECRVFSEYGVDCLVV